MDNYNYPEGSDNSLAPWNQTESKTELIEVTISQTFSKQLKIEVDDYETVKDADEDGVYFWNDYSGCNLKECVEKQHYTINDILEKVQNLHKEFKELVFNNPNPINFINFSDELKKLAEACKDWNEDEMEVIR